MKVYTKAKCRNCGEIFVLDEPDHTIYSKEGMIELLTAGKITETYQCVHRCNDTELGVADAIALVIREE